MAEGIKLSAEDEKLIKQYIESGDLEKLDSKLRDLGISLDYVKTKYGEISEASDYAFNPDKLSGFLQKIEELKQKAASGDNVITSSATLLSSAFIKARDDFRELDLTYGSAAGYKTLMTRYDEMINAVKKSSADDLSGGMFSKYLSAASAADQADLKSKDDGKKSKAAENVKAMISTMLQEAKNQEKLAQSILYQAGQTGTLDKLFERTGNLDKFNEYVAKYSSIITQSGISTGLLREEVVKYYEMLNKVPGAVDQMVSGISGSGASMMDTMITISRGANIPFEKLSEIANKLRTDFNMTFGEDQASAGQEALEFMASMSKASRSLGLDFNLLENNISNISTAFSMYGNTSRDVISSYYQIAKSLEETGLSAKSSGEMAQSYIRHFSELTMVQKSYISQMSGGPGGLRGAFQIEEDLRKGDFKSVFEKFQSTIQRQVGPIVSMEEATQSESAAAKRMQQIAILRAGPLGSLAKDETSAGRLLDAMAQSAKGLLPLEDASKSLEELVKTGEARQSRESNMATVVQAGFDEVTSLSEIIAYNTTQLAFGNKASGTLIGDVELQESIKEAMVKVSKKAAEAGAELRKKGKPEQEATEIAGQSVVRAADIVTTATSGAFNQIKDTFGKINATLLSTIMGNNEASVPAVATVASGTSGTSSALATAATTQVIPAAQQTKAEAAKASAEAKAGTSASTSTEQTVRSNVICATCNTTLIGQAIQYTTDCAIHGSQNTAATGTTPTPPTVPIVVPSQGTSNP